MITSRLKINKSEFLHKVFFIMSFFCINVCEFVKNIYFLFVIGILCLIFASRYNSVLDRDKFRVVLAGLALVVISRVDNPLYSFTDTGTIKFLIFMAIMVLLAVSKPINVQCYKYAAIFGYIHVLATWFFFFVPSAYPAYALRFYGGFPIGTNYGLTGYTAALTSHYSANALYITGCLFGLIALWYNDKKNKKIILAIIIAVGALLLSNKRAHLLFMAFSLYLVMCIIYRHRIKEIVNKTFTALVILSIIVVISTLVMPQLTNVLSRMDEGTSGRTEFWIKALEWFSQKPIFGIGWLQFGNRYAQYNWGKPVNTHNVYIQVLCESGLIGVTLYMLMVFGGLRISVKKFIYARQTKSKYETLLFYSVAIQIFYILYNLTGNCLYDNTLFYYAIALGLGLQAKMEKA